MINDKYNKIFGKIPIFGMIHLSGDQPVKRAMEELQVFEEEGIDGAIIENYHGTTEELIVTLEETHKSNPNIIIGVNVLPNEFEQALSLAHQYRASFIQLDQVAGEYAGGALDFESYKKAKEKYKDIIVLGGVWPKYYKPVEGSCLETDLNEGMTRAEAIVVTGEGTGKETPVDKIKRFREIIGDHPLVVGAGLTLNNAYEQLSLSNGAIIGSSLKKGGKTYNSVDRKKVKDFMDIVKNVRNS